MIDFDLKQDSQGRLVLIRPGMEDAVDVRIRRAFPWSSPSKHISIRAKDGKEILIVDDLENLPAPLRKTIEQYLSSTSLIPRIQRIVQVDVRFGFQQWSVQTDRGPADFRVQEREDIRFMPDGRFSIKDADGNLYELPPLNSLDEMSQSAVEAVV
jgi:hypothetical protein